MFILHKQLTTLFILLCLALMLATHPAWGDVYTIIPGRSVEKVKIGMSRSAVHRLLGKPKSSFFAKSEGYGPLNRLWGLNLLYSHDKVFAVYVASGVYWKLRSSCPYATPQGISLNSTFLQVRRAYPHIRGIKRGGQDGYCFFFDDVKDGIAFAFYSQDTVTPSEHPGDILVHAPGIVADPSVYLPFEIGKETLQ